MPYPNTMGLWPNFRSPLIWDVFAVSTYATVSALFWFVGLIPDLATLRDRAQNPVVKSIYGMLAMGWRGSARHWANYETAYLILAGLSTPLVVSVHTVVSFDFAVGVIPGWHATDLPALLRGRRHLRRLRHGADPRHPAAQGLRARGLHHHEAHREHGQGHARDLPRGGLRLPDGGLHGLVQREHLRALHDVEPDDRAPGLDLLDAHPLQRGRDQHAVGEAAPHERPLPLLRLARGQRRDVARAVRDHRDEPPPRLPALLLGHLPRDAVRLVDVHRHDRPLPDALLPVHPLPAHDLDLRDADPRAGGGAQGGEA